MCVFFFLTDNIMIATVDNMIRTSSGDFYISGDKFNCFSSKPKKQKLAKMLNSLEEGKFCGQFALQYMSGDYFTFKKTETGKF